jgi:hypothetical protein
MRDGPAYGKSPARLSSPRSALLCGKHLAARANEEKRLAQIVFSRSLMFAAYADERNRGAILMRSLISLAFFLIPAAASFASVRPAPSPETDLGLASFAMVAGAAFLVRRLRRR